MIVPRNEGNKVNLASRSDSDYAAVKADRKSVTGGVLTMDGTIVQWVCKVETRVSLSTMESEFASASHIRRELLGLRELMRKIGFQVESPMPMLMDNQAAIRQLETEGSMSCVKHVDVCMKFICDYARKDIVKPKFMESRIMKADLLTKVLPAQRIAELRKLLICCRH